VESSAAASVPITVDAAIAAIAMTTAVPLRRVPRRVGFMGPPPGQVIEGFARRLCVLASEGAPSLRRG